MICTATGRSRRSHTPLDDDRHCQGKRSAPRHRRCRPVCSLYQPGGFGAAALRESFAHTRVRAGSCMLRRVDVPACFTHHLPMWLARPVRSATAFCLVALLGALGTGLPSHHHAGTPDPGGAHPTIDADHHSHGTLLVDQEDRVQSAPPELALPSEIGAELHTATTRVVAFADRHCIPARERAPPPGGPRAPPPSA